jgi:hypothetical protein
MVIPGAEADEVGGDQGLLACGDRRAEHPLRAATGGVDHALQILRQFFLSPYAPKTMHIVGANGHRALFPQCGYKG